MKQAADLKATLARIDGRGYKAYKDIEGAYQFNRYILFIDHVQGDPFAPPSRLRAVIPQRLALFPRDTMSNTIRKVALSDFLTRLFYRNIRRFSRGGRGTGRSGMISIDNPGQEVLPRTSVLVDEDKVEARFVMGLPAAGRRVLSRQAEEMIFEELPKIVEESLFFGALDSKLLREHIKVVEDQEVLRARLKDMRLVAFVGNGSVLPRMSGVDPRPMREGVVKFTSPPSLEVEVILESGQKVRGMGIPEGVTLIVGGGYHGKSTLLNAIKLGVYNHIPGDGRELITTRADAVKIRAEDGRSIRKVNISPFINNLPFGRDTTRFSTDDASGSTSQAANIMEALEVGTSLLLIDEDTSATNFMIRDHRMQELVEKAKEPITPFIDKVRQLYSELGVSTILVVGGAGDYFDVADTVIMMDSYLPRDVTGRAREIAKRYAEERIKEGGEKFGDVTPRAPRGESFDPSRGRWEIKIDVKGLHTIIFGTSVIDLSSVEQLVDESQTRAIAQAILCLKDRYMGPGKNLREMLDQLYKDIENQGLDLLSPLKPGNLALPRRYEIACAINRMRSLEMI